MDSHDFRPSSASHNAVAARAPSAVLPASASVHLQRAACHAAVVQVRWDKAIKGFDEDDKAWNGKGGRVDLEDQYNTSFPNQIGPGKVNGKEFQNRLRMPTEEAPPEYPRHVLRCGRGRDHRRRRATQADGRIACNSTRRRSVSPAAEVPHDRRAPCARSVCHLNGEEVLAHRRRLGNHRGQMLDWLGLQFTGGGGVSGAWAGTLVVLMALRAAPYLAGRAARRLARRP